MSARNRII